MSEEQQTLARRAVACKHWRWMPGMAYIRRGYTYRVDPEILSAGGKYGDTCLPDLTDPATLGCLLALVREARKDAGFHALLLPANENPMNAEANSRWWGLRGIDTSYAGYAWESEAEALVAALEAAP